MLTIIGFVCVQNELPTGSGMTFLQVKNHALLTYTKLELFFALLKVHLHTHLLYVRGWHAAVNLTVTLS